MEDSAQKARFYDLIIDRAKKELDACGSPTCDTASLIFRLIPELNINEDERIANEIIQFLLLPHPQFVGKRNYEEWIDWIEKQCKQRSSAEDGKRPLRKLDYEGLTEFEKAVANVCVGWMGKKPNWRHYIKESASILLETATKTSDLIQDAPFEEKPAWKPTKGQMKALQFATKAWYLGMDEEKRALKSLYNDLKKLMEEKSMTNKTKPKYNIGDIIGPLNDEPQRVVGIVYDADGDRYTLERIRDDKRSSADAHAIDSTAILIQRGK